MGGRQRRETEGLGAMGGRQRQRRETEGLGAMGGR